MQAFACFSWVSLSKYSEDRFALVGTTNLISIAQNCPVPVVKFKGDLEFLNLTPTAIHGDTIGVALHHDDRISSASKACGS